MSHAREIVGLLIILAVVFAAAAAGIPFVSAATSTWYHDLFKPSWSPPNWLFGPVWTVLYLLMAVAAWMVWRTGGFVANRLSLSCFIVQLILNAAWTPIFFGARLFGVAAIEIFLLFFSILLCIILFRRVRPAAAWLLLPYLFWVGFASALNLSIWWLNR